MKYLIIFAMLIIASTTSFGQTDEFVESLFDSTSNCVIIKQKYDYFVEMYENVQNDQVIKNRLEKWHSDSITLDQQNDLYEISRWIYNVTQDYFYYCGKSLELKKDF